MYDPALLKVAFESLIGIRQSYSPGVPLIQSPLSVSNTGIYVDDKHPLVATENLWYSCPNFEPTQFPTFQTATAYVLGNKVVYGTILYKANGSFTSGAIPPTDTINWTVWNPFQERLQQKYSQAVSNLFATIVKRKKLLNMGKAILERIELYRGGGSIYNRIIPQDRAVGFEIRTVSAEGLWTFIEQMGIQFLNSQYITVYLYHSDTDAQLGSWIYSAVAKTFSWMTLNVSIPWVSGSNFPVVGTIVSYNGLYYSSRVVLVNDTVAPPSDAVSWLLVKEPALNCIMKYMAQNTSGAYYFVYYESDIEDGNFALSKTWNCSNSPCAGCDGVDLALYNQWSRYTWLRNIQVPSSALNVARTLFDCNQISYDSATNWGMNLKFSVRCDMTDFIIDNLPLWADAFAMQVCKEFLEDIAYGIRIGPSPAQTKLSAIAALDEKAPGNWITKEDGYYATIDALNIDFSGFSQACMPCERKNKAKNYTM